MKFAHLADCHIGSWRDPKMSDISLIAFNMAVDRSIEAGVDFFLVSGDLFNTSVPGIDKIKGAILALRKLKIRQIPVYAIAGSHDFSPSGKTMLDVLEHADLLVNVCKGKIVDDTIQLQFTVDPKTGAKITGMVGKKGMLDRHYYTALDAGSLEREDGFKIFLFHTAITELKPSDLAQMESAPISFLPKGFDYYAGGHVHIVNHSTIGEHRNIVYPGPLFPNSFSEIEKLGCGGFYLYDNGRAAYQPLVVYPAVCLVVDCNYKNANEAQSAILDAVSGKNVEGSIVTIRASGQLSSGKISDIAWNKIFEFLYEKNAYFVMKNTNQLVTQEYSSIAIHSGSTEDVEHLVIKEHLGQIQIGLPLDAEEAVIKSLLHTLNTEKSEGERVIDFEERVIAETQKTLDAGWVSAVH